MTFPIRAMRPADAPAVLAIYQDGLDSGEASFETTAPDWAAFDAAKLPERVGGALLDALIGSTERGGIWTIQSGIFPENAASVALHTRAGFRVVGVRERLGRHYGRWRDVVLVERRSPLIG